MTTHAHDELTITHDRADEAADRFIRHYFGNQGTKPEIQIPARPYQDDDLVLGAYIKQQREREAALTQELDDLKHDNENWAKINNELAEEVVALTTQLEVALEALEWYSNQDNYEQVTMGTAVVELENVILDDGEKARNAIEQIKGGV